MKRFGFPRKARVTRARDFERLTRQGGRLVVFPLRFRVLKRSEGKSRLGLAVSRKVGPAPVRNRWKRAVREAFRLNRHRLRQPYDLAVSVYWDASPEHVGRVEGAFLEAIEKLNAEDEEDAGADSYR